MSLVVGRFMKNRKVFKRCPGIKKGLPAAFNPGMGAIMTPGLLLYAKFYFRGYGLSPQEEPKQQGLLQAISLANIVSCGNVHYLCYTLRGQQLVSGRYR